MVEPFGIAALGRWRRGSDALSNKRRQVVGSAFAVDWDVDEFASRMAELLSYPALSRAMGAAGRAEATEFGWAERALETARIYAELVAPRGTYR